MIKMSKLVGAIFFKTAHMDMLLITTNDRSTRFWGKLSEGFFQLEGHPCPWTRILNLYYSTWIIFSPAVVALLYHAMQLTWFL